MKAINGGKNFEEFIRVAGKKSKLSKSLLRLK